MGCRPRRARRKPSPRAMCAASSLPNPRTTRGRAACWCPCWPSGCRAARCGPFAKVATLRWTLILPVIMPIVYVGAFEGSHSWGDLFVLLTFGLIGWIMKRLKWARPPLILGLVLGVMLERYMSISVMRYGMQWLTRPAVLVLLVLSAMVFLNPLFKVVRTAGFARLPRLRSK